MIVERCAFADLAPWISAARRERVAITDTRATRWWRVPGAGCAGMLALARGGVRLKALWIEPEHRGMGHGRTLIDHRIAVARAEGAAWIEVYALHPESYERRGFVRVRDRGRGVTVLRLAP